MENNLFINGLNDLLLLCNNRVHVYFGYIAHTDDIILLNLSLCALMTLLDVCTNLHCLALINYIVLSFVHGS